MILLFLYFFFNSFYLLVLKNSKISLEWILINIFVLNLFLVGIKKYKTIVLFRFINDWYRDVFNEVIFRMNRVRN